MRLPDGRVVPDLHLDPDVVARCRTLADRVSGAVMEYVERHTTVSIERTVLRQLGFHDAGPRGIPLVNLMVDVLRERGLLGRGAAYWVGWALRRGARDPLQIVDRITSLPRDPDPLPPEEDRALRDEVRAEVRAAADELRRRVTARNALKAELGMGAPTSSPSSGPRRSRSSTTSRTAPRPRGTAAPTPRRRTSASCARPSTTSRGGSGAT
jgi:beta-lysine 5,6-aminomutase alpha subunit